MMARALVLALLAGTSLATSPVQFTADQQKHTHSGCVAACTPPPVESKCVSACEVAMYKCIDHTGPNETPKDTKACEDKTLKLYGETKGVEKKEEKKKEEGKKAEKKAKMFLQVRRNIDDDNAEAAEMARLEAQSDKDMGEDDDESSKSGDSDDADTSADEESFVQVKRNIDDDNAEAAEMARLEAQSDKDMGEDDDDSSKADTDDSNESDDSESFIQKSKNIHVALGDLSPAELAKAEAQSVKDMGEDDDDSSKSDDTDAADTSADEESFVQVKRNIDDDNAEAAEMARLEAQSDKDMGEDEDESSKSDDSNDADTSADEESFVQVKRNIDDDNAEAAEMARLEAQSDKDMGEDDDESSKSGDSDDADTSADEESFVQVKRNIRDDNAEAAEMARLEAQSDKDMGEDDDESSKSGDSDASDDDMSPSD